MNGPLPINSAAHLRVAYGPCPSSTPTGTGNTPSHVAPPKLFAFLGTKVHNTDLPGARVVGSLTAPHLVTKNRSLRWP